MSDTTQAEQLALLGDPRPPPQPSQPSELQQIALTYLRAHPGGAQAVEVGQHVHAVRGTHSDDHICKWCKPTGLGLLDALAKKRLADRKGRRGGLWVPLGEEGHRPTGGCAGLAGPPSSPSSPALDADGFPEGF